MLPYVSHAHACVACRLAFPWPPSPPPPAQASLHTDGLPSDGAGPTGGKAWALGLERPLSIFVSLPEGLLTPEWVLGKDWNE